MARPDPRDLRRCLGSGRPFATMRDTGFPCSECEAIFAPSIRSDMSGRLVPEHCARIGAPSARYIPRLDAYHHSAILHACTDAGLAEEQVIDLLAEKVRELEKLLMRAIETNPAPMVIRIEGKNR